MKRLIRSTLQRLGYDIVRYPPLPVPEDMGCVRDLAPDELAIIAQARPYTMTSLERIAALVESVNYLTKSKIPGDIAECGVWRGGSMMIVALMLLARGDRTRSLFLYDTFEGMPPPAQDDADFSGAPAVRLLNDEPRNTGIWCYATLDDVRANLLSTGYPSEKIHFIKGKVEDTIPRQSPGSLALLRLDTDWYESTRHELAHLYPLLCHGGMLIVDDYGHWQGARKAVDEYMMTAAPRPYLHRVDYTGRLAIKP